MRRGLAAALAVLFSGALALFVSRSARAGALSARGGATYDRRRPWVLAPPLEQTLATDGWGQPRAYRGGVHAGMDFRAAVGTPIFAMAPGVVHYVDTSRSTHAGNAIGIAHAPGMVASYAHLSKIYVAKGDVVTRGQLVGATGTSAKGDHEIGSPHLHMTIRIAPEYLPRYVDAYGTPRSGFFDSNRYGVAVPIEPLFPMQYLETVVAEAGAAGVLRYA